MNKKFLHKLPAWLAMSPWLPGGCAVVLAGCVRLYVMINRNREKHFTIQITQEICHALIYSLVSDKQSGSGKTWNEE